MSHYYHLLFLIPIISLVYSAPRFDDWSTILREAWARAESERVEVACPHGRGRTGTALACLAVLDGIPRDRAVDYVREHYSQHAVETPWQRRFVRSFPATSLDKFQR